MMVLRNLVLAALIFATISVVSSDFRSVTCRDEWQSNDRCMKGKQNEYRKTVDLSSQDQSDLKYKLRQCYKTEGCQDPFLSDREQQIRQSCYLKYKDRMREDLKRCVQSQYNDFDLPAEKDDSVSRGQDMLALRRSSCRPRNQDQFKRCLFAARGQKGFNQRPQKTDYCQVRSQCYQDTRARQDCYDRSARVVESLCSCTKSLPASSYRDMYQKCLQENGAAVSNETRDYNILVLNKLNSGDKYCSNYTDPCGGFKGRRNVGRRRQGGDRGRSQQGGGNRGTDGRGWLPPGGSGDGGSSGGSSSNSGNFQNSGSQSVSSSSSLETGDLGTPFSSGVDFGSLSSSGGIVPDPNSMISSLGSTDLGSTSLGSTGGGLNPASLLGNGFDFTSMLGGSTGGAAGGILGGAQPFDLSSVLTGGNSPFSGILSGFGGKKKK